MHVSEGQLYAATVADFSGGEPLIHRDRIRTERSDLNQLNGEFAVSVEATFICIQRENGLFGFDKFYWI